MREDALLSTLGALFATADPSVRVGSGPDDCALVELDGRLLSVSTDAFVEGGHFLADTPAADVAYKALAASLSDLAASACRARWVVVTLALRKGLPASWPEEFARALAAAAREWEVTVVGGDTVSSDSGVFVSVTAFGEPLPGGPLLRRGARPGDDIVVTGALGGSLAGRHLRPTPRLREMRFLMEFSAARGGVFPHAAMDISDGLALDLSRLCRESGVGAVLDEDAVPIAPEARELAAASGQSPLAHALADGEDFELLLAMPPPLWEALRRRQEEDARAPGAPGLSRFSRIGSIMEGDALFLRGRDGVLRPLAPEGYQHQW